MRVDKNTLSQPASQPGDSTLLTFKLRVKKDNRIIKSWLKKFFKVRPDQLCSNFSKHFDFCDPIKGSKINW